MSFFRLVTRAACATLIAVVSAASPSPAADAVTVYAGTVGTLPIVARFGLDALGDDPADARGRYGEYFYRSRGIGIRLRASGSGTAVRYDELRANAKPEGGAPAPSGNVWSLGRDSGATIVGTWSGANGTTLPIRLERIGLGREDSSPEKPDAYDAAMLAGPLATAPAVAPGGLAYRRVTDPRYGVASARVPASTAAGRAANRTLDAALDASRIEAFDCDSIGAEREGAGDYVQRMRVASFTSAQISLEIHASWSACAAYPNNDISEPVTVDLRDGSSVRWDRAFGSEGLVRLSRSYREAVVRSHDGECIPLVAPADPIPMTMFVDRQGFVVRASLPHVSEACAVQVTLPFATVRPMLRASYRTLLAT